MNVTLAIGPLIALVAGILILIAPRLLNFIVAIYLIVIGLLVLTQDGRVARQLFGEDSTIEKEYLVRVATRSSAPLPADALALLCHGLELDGEALLPATVEWVNDDQLRFVLQEGKKRQIRRMCDAVGLQVLGLKRVRIGAVMLGALPAGQWRYLRFDERFVAAPGANAG